MSFIDAFFIGTILLLILIPRFTKLQFSKWFFWGVVILNIGIRVYLVQLKNNQKERIDNLEQIQSFIRDIKIHVTIVAKTKKRKIGSVSNNVNFAGGGLNKLVLFNSNNKKPIFFVAEQSWSIHQFKEDSLKLSFSYIPEGVGDIIGKPISFFKNISVLATDYSMILEKNKYQFESSNHQNIDFIFEINGVPIKAPTIIEREPGQLTNSLIQITWDRFNFFDKIPAIYKETQLGEI